MTKLGFIGAGNMGEAILRGVLKANMLSPHNVYIFDVNTQKVKSSQEELGVLTAQSSFAMAAACDVVLLAQASMLSVVETLEEGPRSKVLSSPRLGVERVIASFQ